MSKKVELNKFDIGNFKRKNMLIRVSWYFLNELFLKNSFFIWQFPKIILLKSFGAKIGIGLVLKPSVNIKYPWNLKIGNNCWIGENVWIDNLDKVIISDNVCLSQGSMLLCGNHDFNKPAFDLITGEIRLNEGVWVGAKSIVCPGVTLETNSVLAVNSVASKNLLKNGVYRGNPAILVTYRKIS
ncbi:MAG: colanic acid biosynthesis acetyltransferase WcaF [Porticoccus sp.]|nr:colanic acid biosynthesis acetyltransferase WcaF [Porticoccus sp.]